MISDIVSTLSAQFWTVPYLTLYIVGVWLALNRRDMGRASSYAAGGFSLLLLSTLVSATRLYWYTAQRRLGHDDIARFAEVAFTFSVAVTLTHFAGIGLVIAAVFAKRPRTP